MISEKLRADLLDYLADMSVRLGQAQALIRNEAGETPSPAADPMQTEMRWLQELLKNWGFDPGPIDGVWGPETAKALSELRKRLKEWVLAMPFPEWWGGEEE